MSKDRINTVQDMIDMLSGLDPEMMIRAGLYDTWRGEWKLTFLASDTLFTDETGGRDLSDKERDRDIETLILY